VTCGTVVIMPKFDAGLFLNLVQQEKCTHTFMVPTQFIRIMAHPDFDQFDTSSMEIMLCSAAPLRKSTKMEILEKFPATKLVELYGVTEGIATILRPNEQFKKPGSVGKPRIGGDIKIIDEKEHELSAGEIGEIVGYNAALMKGYHNRPGKTEEVIWSDSGGRQYVKTGDMGKLDEEGYLYIVDRKKDMIISGGFNIYPSDIEDVIMKHPDVAECAVIGIFHEEWGETPMACVIRNKGATITEDVLKDWVNAQVAKYQRIARVEFKKNFPRNALEKILKRELRRPYWEGHLD
jgi:acyl-CoA synthetase (AMP-forming)/AMP-acid ligase II